MRIFNFIIEFDKYIKLEKNKSIFNFISDNFIYIFIYIFYFINYLS
jgi:hypothetical protein